MKPTTLCASAVLATAAGLGVMPDAVAAASTTPDLPAAIEYLTTTTGAVAGGTTLGTDGYVEQSVRHADFGLTISAAQALAAAGTPAANAALAEVVDFVAHGSDGAHHGVRSWTGASTPGARGVQSGSVAEEALLAEIVGASPRAFGGQNLIGFLDRAVCPSTSIPATAECAAPGDYDNASTTIAQSAGVIAQLRADDSIADSAGAGSPVGFLESLQQPGGGWPSAIPAASDATSDPGSTAMAVMALSMFPSSDSQAATAVTSGLAWLAAQQSRNGGWATASAGDNVTSTALAIMALGLDARTYAANIGDGRRFLAGQQNADTTSAGYGGFFATSAARASNVGASAQALNGAVGTSLGRLSDRVLATRTVTGAGVRIIRTGLSSRRWRIVFHRGHWWAGTVTYTLSAPARVTLTFTRAAGRGWIAAGALVHNSHKGFNRVPITGGAGVRRPTPGRYRVVIDAARSGGVDVRAKPLTFTIAAPPHHRRAAPARRRRGS